MPMLIPIAVAAFEAYAGVAALAAGVEGMAAVAAGLEIAGATLTVVGTVTGNKTLSMIGGVAGLAGGGLSAFDSASNALTVDPNGMGLDAEAHGFNAAKDVGTAAAPSAAAPVGDAGLINAAAPAGNAVEIGQVGQTATPGVDPNAPPDTAPAETPPVEQPKPVEATPTPPAAPETPQPFAAPGAGNPGNAGPDYGLATGPGSSGTSQTFAPTPDASAGTTSQSSSSWYSQLGDSLTKAGEWSKANPALTKVAGGLVQGAMNYYGGQQMADDNLKRAQKYQDWVRQRYSDSVKNLSVPQAQVTAAPPSGIINGAKG